MLSRAADAMSVLALRVVSLRRKIWQLSGALRTCRDGARRLIAAIEFFRQEKFIRALAPRACQ
jgi:hypothetical protein